MIKVDLEDARLRLPDLVAAAIRGDDVVIVQGDRPVVKLVPVEPIKARPRFGSARGSILFMADDFDAPLEDFKEYME